MLNTYKYYIYLSSVIVFIVLFVFTATAFAADGPGFGNLTYTSGEHFRSVGTIASPESHGNVAMINGYLMVPYSSDSGGNANNGGIDFWNISNPRQPSLAFRYDNADTHGLREAHGFGFSNSFGGDHVAFQAVDGIQIWDVSRPESITMLSYLDLPGISRGDYSGNWWTFWQAPYVYVAGQGSGLYVIDASNPSSPVLVKRMQTTELNGVKPGVVNAIGNLLIVSASQGRDYLTLDISDPVNPVPKTKFTGKRGYSHHFAAGKLLTSGGDGDPEAMYVHEITHNGDISYIGRAGNGFGLDNGGYGSYQDGYFHSGFSYEYVKFDVAGLSLIDTGSAGINNSDEDFAQVIGNVVFVGNDHTGGSGLIAHQRARDLTGPSVEWVHPASGATNQALTSRVGISLSDNIELDSISPATFIVRPQGGSPLSGSYSVQFGIVNFSPDQPLQVDTTYEVVVSGLRDWAGNLGINYSSSFSTGAGGGSSNVAPRCELESVAPELVGDSISFTSSITNAASVSNYSWNFGDGSVLQSSSNFSSIDYTYSESGRFSVVLTVENTFGSSSCSQTEIIHWPINGDPSSSSTIIARNGVSYNVNPDNNSISAVNISSNAKLWERAVGESPHSLAFAGGGDIWVVNSESSSITIVSISGTVRREIALPRASRPQGIVFSPSDSSAFISLRDAARVVKIDASGAIVDSIDLGWSPRGLAVNPNGSRLFVTEFISRGGVGRVYELRTSDLSLVRTLELGFDPGPDTEASGRGVPNYLAAVVISPDGRDARVPSKKDNIARGMFRDSQPLTFDSMVRTIISKLDLVAGSEDLAARIDLNDRSMAQSLVYSPYGDLIFVATLGTNTVEVFDSRSGVLVSQVNTGLAPRGLVISGNNLIVHNFLGRSVSIVDISALLAGSSSEMQLIGEVSVVNSETLSSQVLSGKRIFYNAADRRMSLDGYVSCASCHLDGEADGQVWDFTQNGEGLRNTISLVRVDDIDRDRFHWTSNFDEIQDFEHDIRTLAGGSGFLSTSQFNATSDPLGNPKAGLSSELDALAAYVDSLDKPVRSPHRQQDGSLTAEAAIGKQLFANKSCGSCHNGLSLSDGKRHDVGTITQSSGEGIGQPLEGVGFDTPPLIGLFRSAPYLHNGEAATLEEVLSNTDHVGPLTAQGTPGNYYLSTPNRTGSIFEKAECTIRV